MVRSDLLLLTSPSVIIFSVIAERGPRLIHAWPEWTAIQSHLLLLPAVGVKIASSTHLPKALHTAHCVTTLLSSYSFPSINWWIESDLRGKPTATLTLWSQIPPSISSPSLPSHPHLTNSQWSNPITPPTPQFSVHTCINQQYICFANLAWWLIFTGWIQNKRLTFSNSREGWWSLSIDFHLRNLESLPIDDQSATLNA